MIKNIFTCRSFSEGRNKKIKVFLIIFVFFSVFFSFAGISQASTEIYFKNASPVGLWPRETKEIFEKDIFSVVLMISSDKLINVINGTIFYDKDKIEIQKVKTGDSLFSLWTEEPAFDNEKGELSFIGGIPNGFMGRDGQILKISFLAKKSGNTLVSFKDIFSVFINDGLGTQINPWLKPLSLSINEKPTFSLFKNIFVKPINYLWIFIFLLLFIIIKMFIRFKNKKRGK